jgi:MAF protein
MGHNVSHTWKKVRSWKFILDNENMNLILASHSPRRRLLLGLTGWDFEIAPADIDEDVLPGETPRAYVLRLAETKARAVGAQGDGDDLVIAADTTVVADDQILGKPEDEAEAEAMLRRLRGRRHQVYTGLAVYHPEADRLLTDLCETNVPMRAYSDAEMRAYVASGDPMDKAGAYAIQNDDFDPAPAIEGCFANVVGLPLCHLTRTFAKMGLSPEANVPASCQAALMYQCPVYEKILRNSRG